MSTITINRALVEQAVQVMQDQIVIDDGEGRVAYGTRKTVAALHKALNAPQPQPVAPPRREWVSLSLDQISMAWDRAYRQPLSQSALNFARDLENTLKGCNHDAR